MREIPTVRIMTGKARRWGMQLHNHIVFIPLVFILLMAVGMPTFATVGSPDYLSPASYVGSAFSDQQSVACLPDTYPNIPAAEAASDHTCIAYFNRLYGPSVVFSWVSGSTWGASGEEYGPNVGTLSRAYQYTYGQPPATYFWAMIIETHCDEAEVDKLDLAYLGWCLVPFQPLQCSPFVFDPAKGVCAPPALGRPCNPECAGDPINTGTGDAYEETTDYRGSGPFPLVFTRTYNSLLAIQNYNAFDPSTAWANENIGQGWNTNVGAHLFINQSSPQILITPCIVNGAEYFCPAEYVDNGNYTIEITVWHVDGDQDQFNYQVNNR